MSPRHRVSRTAIDLIKRFEGYRQKAAQLPDGRWTIGYGHTLTARQGAEVSEADAEALLLYDLIAVSHAVCEQVHAPLGRNQFDAICAFCFNIGIDNFARSGVLRRLNEGSAVQAACAMELWRKAEVGGQKIVVDALVRRRAAEKALFLTPDGGAWPTAPSHILKPLVDSDANEVVPRRMPAEVSTALAGEALVVTRDGTPVPHPAAPAEGDAPLVRAAAEAVTARLSALFREAGEESVAAVEAPEPPAAPAPPEAPPAFTLQPPEFDETDEDEALEADAAAEVEGAPGPDLFSTDVEAALAEAAAANEAAEAAADTADGPAWPGPPREPGERRIIDDVAPFELEDEPIAPSAPPQQEGGALTLLALGAFGLVFFGGGVFWATNARPSPSHAWLDPRTVGWLAGLAGALFFAVAVYLLLQRLGRSSEREARLRP